MSPRNRCFIIPALLVPSIEFSQGPDDGAGAVPEVEKHSTYRGGSRSREDRGPKIVTHVAEATIDVSALGLGRAATLDLLRREILDALGSEAFMAEWSVTTVAMGGKVSQVTMAVLVEARASKDVPALTAFLAKHDGKPVLGHVIRFRKARGAHQVLRFQAGAQDPAGDPWQRIYREDEWAGLFPNYGEAVRHEVGAARLWITRDEEAMLRVVSDHLGPGVANLYRVDVLPKVAMTVLRPRASLLMEGEALSFPSLALTYFHHLGTSRGPLIQ